MDFSVFLKPIPPDVVVVVCLALISLVFVFGVYTRRLGSGTDGLTTMLTTIGILGTFVGIAIGLANFETGDAGAIDRSIPQLLEGLKSAFLTSIIGIAAALLFPGARRLFGPAIPASRKSTTATPTDILNALIEINKTQADALEQQIAIRTGVAGDGDGSLGSQIQKLRNERHHDAAELKAEIAAIRSAISAKSEPSILSQIGFLRLDQRKGFEMLQQELSNFAGEISKISSDNMIKALEDAINHFNDHLAQQLGENFTKFNDAVGVLHGWQERHARQVNELIVAFEQVQSGTQALAAHVDTIKQDTSVIPQHMRMLGTVISTNQAQVADLNRHLNAFAETKNAAIGAMPVIRKVIEDSTSELTERIGAMTESVGTTAQRSSEHIRESAATIAKVVNDSGEAMLTTANRTEETMSSTVNTIHKQLNTSVEKTGERLQETVKSTGEEMSKAHETMTTRFTDAQIESERKLNEALTDAFTGQAQRIGELSEELKSRMETNIHQFQQTADRQFEVLDTGMEKTLHDCLQTLAEALAGITHKFTGDYNSILENFRTVFEDLETRSRVSH